MLRSIQFLRTLAYWMLILFSLCVGIISVRESLQTWNPELITQNMVSKWERRMIPVHEKLPTGLKEIGYIDESFIPGIQYNPVDLGHEFILTQYALAPLVVKQGLEYEWVIGNFSQAKFDNWLREKLGAYEIQDLGSGIYLIHDIKG